MSLHRWHPDDTWVVLWQAAPPVKARRSAAWPYSLAATGVGAFLAGVALAFGALAALGVGQ